MRHKVWQSGSLALGLAAVAVAAVLVAPATAADEKKAEAKPQGAWVKLCKAMPFAKRGADGKPQLDKEGKPEHEDKTVCSTQHEAIDRGTGIPVVTAVIREVEGQPQKAFTVGLPLGMNIPTGLRIGFHKADEWEKLAKDGKYADPKSVKWTKLDYVYCLEVSCIAEMAATPEFIKQLESNAVMMVAAVHVESGPFALPVPLTGFSTAYKGKPADIQKYVAARQQMMVQIRDRQKAAIEAFKKTAQDKAAQDKTKKQ